MQDLRAEQAAEAATREPDPDERVRVAAGAERIEARAQAARNDVGAMYDTAERRASAASTLTADGLEADLVNTQMQAGVSQAKPERASTSVSET